MPASVDLELPKVFGRYLLLRRLSRGGMGELFVAKSGQLSGFEKLCVIKKVLSHLAADREFIHRFIDEASVAIKLSHANVAQVFEVGMADSEYFLAMEWVDGRDARRIVARLAEKKMRLPVELALLVMRDVATGLAYAHRRTDENGKSLNLVHCDISPPNVLVAFEGEVKIVDFGIAKSALRATQTNPKIGFGKYGYMAPEQLVQGGVVDRRTDVYAAGVLLFELLTGKRMFVFPEGADYRQMARIVAQGQHPRPSDTDPALAGLDDLVLTAVAPDPTRRFATAEELRDALQMAIASRSPTLTNDRLGAFMRDMFVEEMTEEREALKRARAVDLARYSDELEGGRTETVTFAAAEEEISGIRGGTDRQRQPLPAPLGDDDEPEEEEEPTRVDPHAALRPPSAPRELTVSPVLLEPEEELVPPRRSRGPYLVAALAVIALVMLLLVVRGSGSPPVESAPAPPPVAAHPTVQPYVVQPIAAPPPVAAAAAAPDAAPAPPPITAVVAPPSRPERPVKPPPVVKPPRPSEPSPEAPSAASVQAKYQAVARDYVDFRKHYGARLEADWNDILDFATYGTGEDKQAKLDAKINLLRRRMNQIKAGND